ncbi:uncharacterized protein LOC131405491 [Diceros bicornis minor]|uniref:uncharacterized protein LOC131405491 n=1 Tax=Diceros bicornis minor TaxID=77932 RepID=UPI0026F0A046|nr:uncharacterized protein LOC131405491 [Diceros bicornis minor]
MDYAEGEDVNLPCNHSTISGDEYIHWYRQNPNQSPQYIIHGLQNTVNNSIASLTIATDRKSNTLILPQVTLRDTVVYYCILAEGHIWSRLNTRSRDCQGSISLPKQGSLESQIFPFAKTQHTLVHSFLLLRGDLPEYSSQLPHCPAMFSMTILMLGMLFTVRGTGAQSVTQPDDHTTVSEGDPLELKCNYSYSGAPYLFWYVQYPSQGLQLLLKYTSGATLVKGIKGFQAEFKKSETSFHLWKPSAHLSDSAEYFCALSDTVTETVEGAEHKPPETLGFSETKGHSLTCFYQGLSCYESEQGGEQSPGECLAPEDKQELQCVPSFTTGSC